MREKFYSLLRIFALIPAFIGSLLPVFKACPPCPVCMPIYAGLLSLLGLELAEYGMYVVPVMLGSMALTIGSIGYQAIRYHGHHTLFFLCLGGCSAILSGKFLFDFLPLVYLGMLCLITSVIGSRIVMRHHHNATTCSHHCHSHSCQSSSEEMSSSPSG